MKFSASTKGKNKKTTSAKSKNRDSYSSGGARRAGRGLVVFLVIIALLLGSGGVGYFFVNREITGKRGGDDTDVVLNIEPGTYGSDVIQMLKDEDVIGSVNIFKTYYKLFGNDKNFTEGVHTVNATMHYDEIIEELQRTTHDDSRPTFRITFPEGTGCLKMGMMLEDIGFCTAQEFVDACNNDIFDVSFYDKISDDPNKFVKIEGFLYPDTYEFYEDATVQEVILKMLQNFESRVMTDDIMAQIDKSDFTFEEVIIFSSIVQKESLPEVADMVASVFYNRLASPDFDKFESCTTDDFIREVLTPYYGGSLSKIPAGMIAAYDTYNYAGLPVGAITNPGVDMILATLNPADTPYYFFCTNVETGEFFWATTNAEHEANLIKAGIN